MTDPYLLSYSVIMVDEAHERTLHTGVCVPLIFGMIELISVFECLCSISVFVLRSAVPMSVMWNPVCYTAVAASLLY